MVRNVDIGGGGKLSLPWLEPALQGDPRGPSFSISGTASRVEFDSLLRSLFVFVSHGGRRSTRFLTPRIFQARSSRFR